MLTRNISTEEYGLYVILTTTATLIATIMTQWLIQSILYYRPKYHAENNIEEFNYYIIQITRVICVITGLILIICIVLGSVFTGPYTTIIPIVLIISFQSIFTIYQTILQSDMNILKFSLNISLASIIKFIFIFIVIFFIRNNMILILWGIAISYFSIALPFIINSFKKHKIDSGNYNFIEFLKNMLNYGLPMIGWFLAITGMTTFDRYIIGLLRNSHELGLYSANFSIVTSSLALLFTPFINLIHPLIMKEAESENFDKKRIESLLTKFTNIFLLFSLPILVLIFVFRYDISLILLGENYTDGSDVIPILMIGIFFWNLSMIGQKSFEVTRQTNMMFKFSLLALIINIVANIYFVSHFGYIGAAWASVFSYTAYFVCIKIFSNRNLIWFLDIKLIAFSMIINIIGIFIISAFDNYILFDVRLVNVLIKSIIFILIYGFFVVGFVKFLKIDYRLS